MLEIKSQELKKCDDVTSFWFRHRHATKSSNRPACFNAASPLKMRFLRPLYSLRRRRGGDERIVRPTEEEEEEEEEEEINE